MRWILFIGVVSLAWAQQAPAGDAKNGRKLYESYGCYQCHGHEGQGAAGTGARLAPNPIAWIAFSRYVRQPGGQMPPYTAKVVPDNELGDIYAFLRSIPQPKPAKEIPQLR